MTGETAEDPWAGFTGQSAEEHAHAEGWAAGRASRDAEVAELAQMKADLADWEQNGAPAWVAAHRKRESELLEGLTESRARALAAEAVIEKVRALHPVRRTHTGSSTHGGPEQYALTCGTCGALAPCAHLRALDTKTGDNR